MNYNNNLKGDPSLEHVKLNQSPQQISRIKLT